MVEPNADKEVLHVADYCTVREAADYAGCTVATIRQWVHEKRIKAKRPIARGSSRIRVNVASLRKMVDS